MVSKKEVPPVESKAPSGWGFLTKVLVGTQCALFC